MMTLVVIPISSAGGICCNDDKCPFNRECANHVTAGDFRSEGGFSPEFKLDGNMATCLTRNANPIYGEYNTLPVNHDRLKRGEVYKDKYSGKLCSYDPFAREDAWGVGHYDPEDEGYDPGPRSHINNFRTWHG